MTPFPLRHIGEAGPRIGGIPFPQIIREGVRTCANALAQIGLLSCTFQAKEGKSPQRSNERRECHRQKADPQVALHRSLR